MEKPIFEVGSEKRFAEFISNLNDKDKIALISHTDLDGVASAKIVHAAIDANYIDFVNYEELTTELIEKLRKQKITKLIMTDLMMDSMDFVKAASKYFDVLWIDHHRIIEDVNSEKVVYFNPGGNNKFCATYLCYYLFSKIKELENYDWLVACACLSDFTIRENKNWMKQIFEKYHDKTEIKPMSEENGSIQNLKRTLELGIIYFKTNDNLRGAFDLIGEKFGDLGNMEKYSKEVADEIKFFVNQFEKKKIEINSRYIFEFEPKFQIGALVSNATSMKRPDKTFIFFRPIDERHYAISMRRQDSGEDMNWLMKTALSGFEESSGGGHIPAAGGHFLKKDKEKLMKRLSEI